MSKNERVSKVANNTASTELEEDSIYTILNNIPIALAHYDGADIGSIIVKEIQALLNSGKLKTNELDEFCKRVGTEIKCNKSMWSIKATIPVMISRTYCDFRGTLHYPNPANAKQTKISTMAIDEAMNDLIDME